VCFFQHSSGLDRLQALFNDACSDRNRTHGLCRWYQLDILRLSRRASGFSCRSQPEPIPLATDDWPYLYLSQRSIPSDYLIVMGTLLALSIGILLVVRPKRFDVLDAHFFFLGLAFLLLETKSIIDTSLYFGATWLVTTLMTAGILLMIFAANVSAQHWPSFSLKWYMPLFICVLILVFVPKGLILSLPLYGRFLWTALAVPLPIFFAGLIFSTTFSRSESPSASFGANLIGATLGGFLEYLGMVTGHQMLFFALLGAYLASFLCVLHWRRPAWTFVKQI